MTTRRSDRNATSPGHPSLARPQPSPTRRHRARPQHRATPPVRIGRRRSGHQLVDVWPVAQTEPLPGTAQLPGWLGRALITLVATYSRPGDRILLVTPPPGPRAARAQFERVTVGRFGSDEFTGLAEAVWMLTRLGRSVQISAAGPTPDYSTELVERRAATPTLSDTSLVPGRFPGQGESESGPRPGPLEHTASGGPMGRSDAEVGEPDPGFDLIITAAHPFALDWLAESDWPQLLTPTGLFALITYGDIASGQLQDGIILAAATLRDRGLRMWDRIALLTQTSAEVLRQQQSAAEVMSPGTAPGDASTGVHASAGCGREPIMRAHYDLLLMLPTARVDAIPPTTDDHTTAPINADSASKESSDD